MSDPESKRLVLIDLSAIFRPVWEAIPETEPASAPHDITASKVRKLASRYDFAGICVDAKTNWRHAVSPTYKANRERAGGEMYAQHDRLVETLRREGFAVWCCDGYEADDVIASAVRQCRADHPELVVHIATADKDLYQLVGHGVYVLPQRLGAKEEPEPVGAVGALDKFGVTAAQIGDFLALVGDASDNVPGIKGIGKVTAAKLLETFGTLEGIFEATKIADPAKGVSARLAGALQDGKDTALLSRKLVALKDDAPFLVESALKVREYAARQGAEDTPPPGEDDENMSDDEETPPASGEQQKADEPSTTEEQTVNNGDGTQSKQRVETKTEAKKEGDAVDRLANFLPDPGSDEWAAALEPRNVTQSWWVAQQLFDSRLFGFKNVAQAYVAILMGRERGIGAAASAAASDIIEAQGKDKLAWKAEALEGLIKKSPLCEYFEMVSCDDTHATYKTKRVGRPERVWTYRMAQADQASLTGNTSTGKPTNWKKRPRNMLRARCKGELAHLEFPDLCLGFWSPEELADHEDEIPDRIRSAS